MTEHIFELAPDVEPAISLSTYPASTGETSAEITEIFRELRALKHLHRLTLNKTELACLLVSVAITRGINSGKRIVGAMRTIGFDYRHVAILLRDSTVVGRESRPDDAAYYWWRIDQNGVYTNLR